jgi:radical SAM protein with 4Fe4S-binding SPASM domain
MLDKLNSKHDELTLEELRKIGRHLSPLQRTHIAGGEPFMRNDISEVIQIIANDWNSEVICLPTNGSFKNKILKTITDFSLHCNKNLRLHFSLNAIDEHCDDFTESKDSFIRWKDSITAVKKITDKSPNITLTALITYNDYNQDHFDELLQFVLNDIGVDDLSIGLVRSHKKYKPEIDIDRFKQIIQKYFRQTSHEHIILRAYRELIREYLAKYHSKNEYITKCYSGKMRIVMSPEGNIYPCEIKGYPEGEYSDQFYMGNIREYNYNMQDLLNDTRAKQIRREILNQKCHCHQGVDLSLNLMCSNNFKFRLLSKIFDLLLKGKRLDTAKNT